MSCSSPTLNGTRIVWTAKSDVEANAIFVAFSDGMNTAEIAKIRTSFALSDSSGGVKVRPAYRTSDDNLSWSAPTTIGTQYLDANGTSQPAGWTDLVSALSTKQLVQFGMIAYNKTTGLAVELGNVYLKIDIKDL